MSTAGGSRLTVWLCGFPFGERGMSYCTELRARLVQRGFDTRVVELGDGTARTTMGDPAAACALVLASHASPRDHAGIAAAGLLRVCLHAQGCPDAVAVLPELGPVAVAVDRTLAGLERSGALETLARDIRDDEQLMVRRLYDLGYL